MELKTLSLENFRNYKETRVEFASGLNLFIGENAQGKTNLLEAVFLLSSTRSHRTRRDREMILFNAGHFRITAELTDGRTFSSALRRDGMRRLEVDGEPMRAMDFLGRLQAVLFTPDDGQLIRGAPELRRRFFSLELSRLDREYLLSLQEYRRILKQRNALLSGIRPERLLPHYDQRLCQAGSRVILRMRQFLADLIPRTCDILSRLPGAGSTGFTVCYETAVDDSFTDETAVCERLRQRLEAERSRDIMCRSTQVGPHRDEYRFLLGGRPLKTYGSQGQVKSAVLAMKLAVMELITARTGERPILLLDDITSELDAGRLEFFLEHIRQRGQVLLTTTGLNSFSSSLRTGARIYQVTDGQATPEKQ